MRETSGNWIVKLSRYAYASATLNAFGGPGALPVPGDYDGDGLGDPAIYAPLSWTEWRSDYNAWGPYQYSMENAMPVTEDFDGDRLADPACIRDNNWYVWLSGAGYQRLGPFEFPAP